MWTYVHKIETTLQNTKRTAQLSIIIHLHGRPEAYKEAYL